MKGIASIRYPDNISQKEAFSGKIKVFMECFYLFFRMFVARSYEKSVIYWK